MKNILIWGFYNQGNIGDDLMATLLYEMLEEAGARPLIFTTNPRFETMGYRTVADYRGLELNGLVLGGGAFFKHETDSKPAIEQGIEQLAKFINENELPVVGLSLGSDGLTKISNASAARQAVAHSPHLQKVVLRLEQDLALGLPNAQHLPDIVLLTAFCSERYTRLRPIDPEPDAPNVLINLSRRSALNLPGVLWRLRSQRPAFFRAHTGNKKTGGEIVMPGIPVIDDNRIAAQLGYLKASQKIISSKLHPG